MRKRASFNPWILVLSILLVMSLFICYIVWDDRNDAWKQVEKYKSSYQKLADDVEREKQEQAQKEEEEQKKREQVAQKEKEYQQSYNQMVSYMLDDAVQAEKLGNLTIQVWHDAIWKSDNDETRRFVKKNGEFVTDFNEALANLFGDADYKKECEELQSKQFQIKNEMKKMLNPPEGYENAFKALEGMYNSYITFTSLVINVDGSLESFSNAFSEADNDLSKHFQAAELYVTYTDN